MNFKVGQKFIVNAAAGKDEKGDVILITAVRKERERIDYKTIESNNPTRINNEGWFDMNSPFACRYLDHYKRPVHPRIIADHSDDLF